MWVQGVLQRTIQELKILQLSSQHIFSLLLYVVNNGDFLVSYIGYHKNNTRQRNDLHLPQVTLAMYQKGVYYSDIIIFNGFRQAIKDTSRKLNNFKIALNHFLHIHTFYSVDEFF